jgi:hypothetical protein
VAPGGLHTLSSDGKGLFAPLLERLLTTEIGIPLETVLVRREVVISMGGCDKRMPFGDDDDVVLRLAHRAPACAVDGVVGGGEGAPRPGQLRGSAVAEG